ASGAAARVPLSRTLGDVAYWLVWLLFLPAILDALNLGGLLAPVVGMLDKAIGYVPNIVAAAVILLVGWFVAGIVRRIVTNLMAGFGFARLPTRLGLTGLAAAPGPSAAAAVTTRSPSQVAGQLVLLAIMLFAAIEAARQLGFMLLADLLAQFLVLAGQILLGLLIIAIGLYLADLVARAVRSSTVQG